jgi:hypothetical protein
MDSRGWMSLRGFFSKARGAFYMEVAWKSWMQKNISNKTK